MRTSLIFFILFALTLLSSLIIPLDSACACTESRPISSRVFPYEAPFQNLRNSISAAMSQGFFRQDDFEKLDFSMPADASYGDAAEFEVFNPFGPFNAQRLPDWKQNSEMFTPATKTVFILRRIINDPSSEPAISDHLIAVLTDLNKEGCEKHRRLNSPVLRLSSPFNLTPHNLGAVEDPEIRKIIHNYDYSQCIADSNDRWYYVEFIESRSKHSPNEPWILSYGRNCSVEEAKKKGAYCPGTYIGWQKKPDIVEAPSTMSLRRFTHRPPMTAEQTAVKWAEKAFLIILWIIFGVWAMSIFLKLGNFFAQRLCGHIRYLDTFMVWLMMCLPALYVLYKIPNFNSILAAILIFWLLCATVTYKLFRRQKLRLAFNEFTSVYSVIFLALFAILGNSGCGNILWPF